MRHWPTHAPAATLPPPWPSALRALPGGPPGPTALLALAAPSSPALPFANRGEASKNPTRSSEVSLLRRGCHRDGDDITLAALWLWSTGSSDLIVSTADVVSVKRLVALRGSRRNGRDIPFAALWRWWNGSSEFIVSTLDVSVKGLITLRGSRPPASVRLLPSKGKPAFASVFDTAGSSTTPTDSASKVAAGLCSALGEPPRSNVGKSLCVTASAAGPADGRGNSRRLRRRLDHLAFRSRFAVFVLGRTRTNLFPQRRRGATAGGSLGGGPSVGRGNRC